MLHREMKRLVGKACLIACCIHGVGCARSQGISEPVPVEILTGHRTRIVWVRQVVGDGNDPFATGKNFVLMGMDTRDGRGERPILDTVRNYRKPLFTEDGERIVFTDLPGAQFFVVNWDGTDLRFLGEGLAMEVWRDSVSGIEWVYYLGSFGSSETRDGSPVMRIRLDQPDLKELVWDQTEVTPDNFQLSADGTLAAGLFPWKQWSILNLKTKVLEPQGKGCWTSMAPDNSYLCWVFDGAHKNLLLKRADHTSMWKIAVNRAPGTEGHEMYHPRWSNHARYIAITGPYRVMGRYNAITGGGQGMNVYVGRFRKDFREIEKWAQVTDHDDGDFFPDVWVSGSADVSYIASSLETNNQIAPATSEFAPIQVIARLVEVTNTPSLEAIKPYQATLVEYVYDVVSVEDGICDDEQIIVQHWGIRDGEYVDLRPEMGKTVLLRLEPVSSHPELQGERVSSTVDDPTLQSYLNMDEKYLTRRRP